MILYNDFAPFTSFAWAASDTETFTYIDGEKVTDAELRCLGKIKEQKFFREHASVRVWAWQVSDGVHLFVTNDFDEYLTFLCEHKIKAVWYYNAKFDFAQIDYQILAHNPPYRPITEKDAKSTPYTFSSLHNDKGGRFSLKVWTPYKHSGKGSRKVDRHEHVHAVTFYDFCNIFGGGLKRLLEEFDVKDFEGVPIRKSEMNYQAVDETALTADELKYLFNDTKGLYHLIRIASDTLKGLTGLELAKSRPDVMTAGGLAKKELLRFLYPNVEASRRVYMFQKEHPITVRQDEFVRQYKLYQGGICTVNKYKQGRRLSKGLYRYDVNSEYPFIMSTMPEIYGNSKTYTFNAWKKLKNKENLINIFVIDEFFAELKKDKIAVFRHPYTGNIDDVVDVDKRFLIFSTEFDELQQWYDIDCQISHVITFNCRFNARFSEFVQTYYELKNTSKKAGKKAITAFSKLMLNSSYGKLAERVTRPITFREINAETGAVHLVNTGDEETDEKGILNVIQGSLVTSNARVWLLSHIREICRENVKENFVYCDTDSVHALVEYDKADAYSLGGFKCENETDENGNIIPFNFCKYIAPKTYFDGIIKNDAVQDVEFHSKGISLSVISETFKNGDKWKSVKFISEKFAYGQKFQPLCGMNVKGGKALIPIEKYLCKPLTDEQMFVWTKSGYLEL